MYGVEVSVTLISNVTNEVIEEVKTWQSRPLDKVYPIVYLDALVIKINEDKRVINKHFYLVLGEDTGWIKRAENLIIFGPSGVGKSHLAAAISSSLIANGIRALFISTTILVQQLQHAKSNYKLPEALVKLSRYPLLILDDIGYAKKDDAETSVLFELIADRYETGSLIITANHEFSKWDKIFPDNMMAVAAIDRLVHHATIISLVKEDSYRRNNAKQSNGKI